MDNNKGKNASQSINNIILCEVMSRARQDAQGLLEDRGEGVQSPGFKISQQKKKTDSSVNCESSKKQPGGGLQAIDERYLGQLQDNRTPLDQATLQQFFNDGPDDGHNGSSVLQKCSANDESVDEIKRMLPGLFSPHPPESGHLITPTQVAPQNLHHAKIGHCQTNKPLLQHGCTSPSIFNHFYPFNFDSKDNEEQRIGQGRKYRKTDSGLQAKNQSKPMLLDRAQSQQRQEEENFSRRKTIRKIPNFEQKERSCQKHSLQKICNSSSSKPHKRIFFKIRQSVNRQNQPKIQVTTNSMDYEVLTYILPADEQKSFIERQMQGPGHRKSVNPKSQI